VFAWELQHGATSRSAIERSSGLSSQNSSLDAIHAVGRSLPFLLGPIRRKRRADAVLREITRALFEVDVETEHRAPS
jgi:hypothetical protein